MKFWRQFKGQLAPKFVYGFSINLSTDSPLDKDGICKEISTDLCKVIFLEFFFDRHLAAILKKRGLGSRGAIRHTCVKEIADSIEAYREPSLKRDARERKTAR